MGHTVKNWRTSFISSGWHRKQEEGKTQVMAIGLNGEDVVEEGENDISSQAGEGEVG